MDFESYRGTISNASFEHPVDYLRGLCFVKLEPGAAKASARLHFLPFLLSNSRHYEVIYLLGHICVSD